MRRLALCLILAYTCSYKTKTRWLYCAKCPQYSIRLEAFAYLCDCL